jgi:hypothetical protein
MENFGFANVKSKSLPKEFIEGLALHVGRPTTTFAHGL